MATVGSMRQRKMHVGAFHEICTLGIIVGAKQGKKRGFSFLVNCNRFKLPCQWPLNTIVTIKMHNDFLYCLLLLVCSLLSLCEDYLSCVSVSVLCVCVCVCVWGGGGVTFRSQWVSPQPQLCLVFFLSLVDDKLCLCFLALCPQPCLLGASFC